MLRDELITLVDPTMDRRLQISGADGAGRRTRRGSQRLRQDHHRRQAGSDPGGRDKSVVLGAADTFRAAAVQQLATWGERVGVEVVRGPEGGDPASVAFEAVKAGVDRAWTLS